MWGETIVKSHQAESIGAISYVWARKDLLDGASSCVASTGAELAGSYNKWYEEFQAYG